MPIYKCNNEKCPVYRQEIRENLHITYSSTGEIDHKQPCPMCNEPRERIYDDKGLCITTKGRQNVPNK